MSNCKSLKVTRICFFVNVSKTGTKLDGKMKVHYAVIQPSVSFSVVLMKLEQFNNAGRDIRK